MKDEDFIDKNYWADLKRNIRRKSGQQESIMQATAACSKAEWSMLLARLGVEGPKVFRITLAGLDDFTDRGIRDLLASESGWELNHRRMSTNYEAVSSHAASLRTNIRTDLFILGMPSKEDGADFDGVTASRFLRGHDRFKGCKLPPAKTLLYTRYYTPVLLRGVMWADFSAYVLQSEIEWRLREAIRIVETGGTAFPIDAEAQLPQPGFDAHGKSLLSTRERWCLCGYSKGYSLKHLAEDMGITLSAAKSLMQRVRRKLELKNPTEVIRYAIRIFMIDTQ